MIYHSETLVTGVANTRTISNGVTSTEEQPKHVNSVTFTEVSAALQHNAVIELWIETERIAEISIVHTLEDSGSDNRNFPFAVPVDYNLPVGQTLKVGHISGGVASDMRFNIQYTIAGA